MTGPLRPAGGDVWRGNSKINCLACGQPCDAFGDAAPGPADKRAPQDGDYSICMNCGEVSIIVMSPLLGVTLRDATGAELAEFAATPGMTATVRNLHRFNADHGGP